MGMKRDFISRVDRSKPIFEARMTNPPFSVRPVLFRALLLVIDGTKRGLNWLGSKII
jgi:hypothetical protein